MNREILDKALNRLASDHTYRAYLAAANAMDKTQPESSRLSFLRIAILRNFTIDPLIPVLRGEALLAGFYPIIYLGDYDAIANDVLQPDSSLYSFQPDYIIVAQWLETVAPKMIARFLSLTASELNDEIHRILSAIGEMVAVVRRHTQSPILLNNFPLPPYPTLGILDAQSESHQVHTLLRLNLELLRHVRQWSNVYLVDYFSLVARIGSAKAIDERYWHIARAPIGRDTLVPLGQEYGKFLRALRGKTRKCLVLDCDNVLWGGIIGEDGLRGIQLGTAYPGSCYRAFQQEILNLHDRGVILALCSKNNEADVLEALRTHPEMQLHESDFATWQINWDDKATNLLRIAQELNIGLDSLVFVDDSQFECDLVREHLPEVAVLQLSSDPSNHRERLVSAAFFDTLTFSDEDRERTRLYQDEGRRKQLFKASNSLEEYLTRLGMEAEIMSAADASIPRVAQLTQKTNQFNLTTHRYSEGEILSLRDGGESQVLQMRLRDRISDMGIVGVAIVKYQGTQAEIDTFLLSCRAIGRGAERALLVHILNSAKAKDCTRVLGHYIATKKNGQVSDFYPQQGFRRVMENDRGSDWEFSLDRGDFESPNWIKVIADQPEGHHAIG